MCEAHPSFCARSWNPNTGPKVTTKSDNIVLGILPSMRKRTWRRPQLSRIGLAPSRPLASTARNT
eukprot:3382551-Pyramimonas_sp.AAC.1